MEIKISELLFQLEVLPQVFPEISDDMTLKEFKTLLADILLAANTKDEDVKD